MVPKPTKVRILIRLYFNFVIDIDRCSASDLLISYEESFQVNSKIFKIMGKKCYLNIKKIN